VVDISNKKCDPLYKRLIEDMLSDHKNDPSDTALVICNSFDNERFEIEDLFDEKKHYTETFEIDRIRLEEREEYLKCLNDVCNLVLKGALF